MDPAWNETILTLGLTGIGLYFTVGVVRGLVGYSFFRRLQPTAIVTWTVPTTARARFLFVLGIVQGLVAVLNSLVGRPFHHVYALGIMAVYFVLIVPLSTRIEQGCYGQGVWSDAGFLAYADIGRLAFRETSEIVLVLLPRRGSTSFRLRVPPGEYGAVRKLIADKVRADVLRPEGDVLGLRSPR